MCTCAICLDIFASLAVNWFFFLYERPGFWTLQSQLGVFLLKIHGRQGHNLSEEPRILCLSDAWPSNLAGKKLIPLHDINNILDGICTL